MMEMPTMPETSRDATTPTPGDDDPGMPEPPTIYSRPGLEKLDVPAGAIRVREVALDPATGRPASPPPLTGLKQFIGPAIFLAVIIGTVAFIVATTTPNRRTGPDGRPNVSDNEAIIRTNVLFRSLVDGIEAYRERTGNYPAQDADDLTVGLLAQVRADAWFTLDPGETGPHPELESLELFVDGWGRPIRYRVWAGMNDAAIQQRVVNGDLNPPHHRDGYDLISPGPDGVIDTEDDRGNWPLAEPPQPPASDGG
jgi:hypothetical protein